MQTKEGPKTQEPKSAGHVHAVGQHQEIGVVFQAGEHQVSQVYAQNSKPYDACHRNQPGQKAQYRVRDPKRAFLDHELLNG